MIRLEPVTLQDSNRVLTAGKNQLKMKTRNCKRTGSFYFLTKFPFTHEQPVG